MDQSVSDQSSRRGVQSVDVGGRLLSELCEFKYPVRLKELAAASDMAAAKAHRYVTSLVRIGLAEQDERTGLYSLGPLALRLGLIAIERNDIIGRSGVVLRKLCTEVQTSGHLAIWGERGPVLIRNEHGGPPIISSMGIGAVMPLVRSATGRVFLCHMPRNATRAIVEQELALTEMNESDLEPIIEETRARGFARVVGSVVLGLEAVAFPVFNFDGSLACCLALVTTNRGFFSDDSPTIKLMTSAVAELNRDWGGVPNP